MYALKMGNNQVTQGECTEVNDKIKDVGPGNTTTEWILRSVAIKETKKK